MKIGLIALLVLFASTSWGQKVPKTQTIVIQTSAECDMCEERLESGLNYTKGVVFSEMDLTTKKITVKYKTKDITPAQIKAKIASIGYSADEVPAEQAGLDKLPACCKPGGM